MNFFESKECYFRNSPDWLGNLYAPCYNHKVIRPIKSIIDKKFGKNEHVCERFDIKTVQVKFITKPFTRKMYKLLRAKA